LLQRFAVTGIVVTASLAMAFAWVLSQRITEQALDQAVQNSAEVAVLGTYNAQAEDFRQSSASTALWSSRLGIIERGLNIIRIKVWSPEGNIVYSDNQQLIGRNFAVSAELTQALRGRVARDISNAQLEENIAERGYKQLLEVYYPVVVGGRVVGVFELYRDFAPIRAHIDTIRQLVWFGALAVFSLLFLALFSLLRAASRQLHFMAYHDSLTGLANRSFLREITPKVLSRAHRSGNEAALLYIDLDRFKEINDSLGHAHGDELLKRVAQRFQGVIRESDTLCRLGGDEFAVLLEEVSSLSAAEVAWRLLQVLKTSFEIAEQRIHLEASIGIALYPRDGLCLDELMRTADVAMYRAKADNTALAHYQANQDHYTLERLGMLSALREAIQNDELMLYYQPILDLEFCQPNRYEALVRWQRNGEMMMPAKFIPLAEETGLICELDRFVLRRAAQEAAFHGFSVSVNLSARSLNDPRLVEWVKQILSDAQLEPQRLWLEITETTLLKDRERGLRVIEALRKLGIHTALDDFGTGYSSLAYLKHLPVDILKIDRSFVAGIGKDSRDEEMIRSVIALAHGLGLRMLAEGVETKEQLEWLRGAGCDLAQGYGIARPTPLEKLSSLVFDA